MRSIIDLIVNEIIDNEINESNESNEINEINERINEINPDISAL